MKMYEVLSHRIQLTPLCSLSKLEEDYSKKVEDAKRQSALEAAEKEQKLQEEVQK